MSNNTSNLDLSSTQYPTIFSGINRYDINNKPFNTYKKWDISSGSDTNLVLPLNAIYSSIERPTYGSTNIIYDTNIDGSYLVTTYFSINHLFYKRKDQPYNTFGSTTNQINKFLYQSASIFSIPGKRIGAGIKPTSFEFTASASPYTFNLKDDKYGNVYVTSFPTSSIVNDCVFYEGFNEYFDTTRVKYDNEYSAYVSYVPGITLTDTLTGDNIGYCARFNGSAYIKQDLNGFYDRDHDYALSFFINAKNIYAGENIILSKLDLESTSNQYPFQVTVDYDILRFKTYSSTNGLFTISSSLTIESWQHVICQKSGSNMQLYINGTIVASASNPAFSLQTSVNDGSGLIDNNGKLYIGGISPDSSNLIGDLDEIRVYNKSLSISEINALKDRSGYGTCLQTNIVGNVFHDQGIVVISSPNPVYHNIINIPNYNAYYRSTLKTTEFSALIRVPAGQYNMSLNSSLLKDDNETYQPFVSGSDFSPYITTIGLYNPEGILMAVAKLAQPIKKRSDVDLNFLIQLDIDQPMS